VPYIVGWSIISGDDIDAHATQSSFLVCCSLVCCSLVCCCLVCSSLVCCSLVCCSLVCCCIVCCSGASCNSSALPLVHRYSAPSQVSQLGLTSLGWYAYLVSLTYCPLQLFFWPPPWRVSLSTISRGQYPRPAIPRGSSGGGDGIDSQKSESPEGRKGVQAWVLL